MTRSGPSRFSFSAGQLRRLLLGIDFDIDRITEPKRTRRKHTARDPAAPIGMQRFEKARISLFHALAGLRRIRHLEEHRPDTQAAATPFGQRHAFDEEVGAPYRPGEPGRVPTGEVLQSPQPILFREHGNGALWKFEALVIAFQPSFERDGATGNFLHRSPACRSSGDADEPAKRGT